MIWTPFTRANHDRSALRYASDLTEREWRLIAPFMPLQPARGRKRSTDLRCVVDAIFYLLQSGCQWSLLPKDFPPKSTSATLSHNRHAGRGCTSSPCQLHSLVRVLGSQRSIVPMWLPLGPPSRAEPGSDSYIGPALCATVSWYRPSFSC